MKNLRLKKHVRNVVIIENNLGGLQEIEIDSKTTDSNTNGKLFRNELVRKLMNPNSLSKVITGSLSQMGTSVASADGSVVDPPYNPEQLAALLTLNATHFRCCETKATDVTAKGYKLLASTEFMTGVQDFTDEEQAEIDNQTLKAKKFLRKVDSGLGYASLSKKLLLDYESIGWMCAEIIRNPFTGTIVNVRHVPAKSIRVVQEKDEPDEIYYIQAVDQQKVKFVNFGEKYVFDYKGEFDEEELDFFNDIKIAKTRFISKIKLEPSDEAKELKIEQINMVDSSGNLRTELTPAEKKAFEDSANELLFIAQPHPATDYYGMPAIIPALASVNGNISIEEYMNQFFENNAIPRYMITLEGIDEVDDNVTTSVTKFFKESIKSSAHSTLIFPVPEGVTVKVEALQTKESEASFQETRIKNRDEILVSHGMTPAQIGIIDVANLGSGSGMSQSENYKDRILGPRQVMFADLFWNRLLGKDGLGLIAVQLSFVAMDIRDENMLRLKIEILLKYGAISLNEARAEYGYEAVTGGNRPFLVVGNQIVFVDTLDETAVNGQQLDTSLNNEIAKALKTIINE